MKNSAPLIEQKTVRPLQLYGMLGLVTLVIVWQIFKGLSVYPGLYPLMTSLFTYADGPVRRGLLPSLMQLFGWQGVNEAMVMALTIRHLAVMGLLAAVFAGMAKQLWQHERWTGPRFVLFILLIASPVLPMLASLNGYSDGLIILGLFAMQVLLNKERFFSAAFLLMGLVLLHEMVLPLALPLWLATLYWAKATATRKRILLVLVGMLVLCTGYLALSTHVQNQLLEVAKERCQTERPFWHPHIQTVQGDEIWQIYCPRQMRATLKTDFVPLRLIVLPFFWLCYGIFQAMLVLLWYGQTRRSSSRITGLVLLPLLFMPYVLVTIAWDNDRFIMLASVTGWLLLDRWLALQPSPPLTRAGQGLVTLLLAVQLAMTYPAIGIYGQYRIMSPELSDRLLINPSNWTIPLLKRLGLVIPGALDPANSVDPRSYTPEDFRPPHAP